MIFCSVLMPLLYCFTSRFQTWEDEEKLEKYIWASKALSYSFEFHFLTVYGKRVRKRVKFDWREGKSSNYIEVQKYVQSQFDCFSFEFCVVQSIEVSVVVNGWSFKADKGGIGKQKCLQTIFRRLTRKQFEPFFWRKTLSRRFCQQKRFSRLRTSNTRNSLCRETSPSWPRRIQSSWTSPMPWIFPWRSSSLSWTFVVRCSNLNQTSWLKASLMRWSLL
jgi:hypothetical protein